MRPNSGVEITAVMKCSQSGFTQSVAIPCMVYHIAESPSNIMFLSSSDIMVQNTIRGRFDTVMESSGLSNLLKTSSVKKANQRTGDTDKKKEYTGGTMINATYNASNLRFHSVEVVVCDEYDDAPKTDKKERYGLTIAICPVPRRKIEGKGANFADEGVCHQGLRFSIAGRVNAACCNAETDCQRRLHVFMPLT